MKTMLPLKLCLLLVLISIVSCTPRTVIRPPVLGPDLMGVTDENDWTTQNRAATEYDAQMGGFRISTDGNGNANRIEGSALQAIPTVSLQLGKAYQFVLRIKADDFPLGQNISIRVSDMEDEDKYYQYAHNVSKKGEWEYVYMPVIPNKNGNWTVKYVFVHHEIIFKRSTCNIFLDPDFDVYEMPPGVEVANLEPIILPRDKNDFLSSTEKVDIWGNIYTKKETETIWNPIFPKMIYKGYNGSYKDVYFSNFENFRAFGFNGVMDIWTDTECQAALNAGLDYISLICHEDYLRHFEGVSAWANGNNRHPNILWTNYDNEKTYAGNDTLQDTTQNRVDRLFIDPITFYRTHPIYYLNGQFGLPRSLQNSKRNVMDITGSYVGTEFLFNDPLFVNPIPTLMTEFLSQNQTAPISVIQLQSYYQENFMPSLFYGLIQGGKALSVWRDSTLKRLKSRF